VLKLGKIQTNGLNLFHPLLETTPGESVIIYYIKLINYALFKQEKDLLCCRKETNSSAKLHIEATRNPETMTA